jgi:glycerol-3-phosphate dehydrogenase (NAD(P)+)
MAHIVVLGAGAWGTALAVTLSRGGARVTLAVRRRSQLDAIRRAGENTAYLPGVAIPPAVALSDDWGAAVRAADAIVMAVPSPFARQALTPIATLIPPAATIISVTKGIEVDSMLTMAQMIAELAPPSARVAALSGPGFAAEIAAGKPAALVAAAADDAVARTVQQLFALKPIRIYRSLDLIGVELGGAAKNVIAIAAGISDGLGLGTSARAALITRGLAEMMRLVEAAGGSRETMAGLAGLGDLVLTCTGGLSRNRALGFKIGSGEHTEDYHEGRPVAEGVANASALRALAVRLGVEMPIVSAVARILYEAAPANAMVEELLSRELKAEF